MKPCNHAADVIGRMPRAAVLWTLPLDSPDTGRVSALAKPCGRGNPSRIGARQRRGGDAMVRFEADVRVTPDATHLAFESIDWVHDY